MWIFGYGSLVWKADFPFEKKVVGYIKGYLRRFYQHSIDHRGVPDKPGRVVTLIPSDDLESRVWGIAYKINSADVDKVSQHLDYREKNGYTKSLVTFYPHDSEKDVMEPFKLTIYVATQDNEAFAGPASIQRIAQQVITSKGPSGPNKEYIYNLASAMRAIAPGVSDDHLFSLEAAVRKLDEANSNTNGAVL